METHGSNQLTALGDATRQLLLERLRRGPLAVVDLARGLPVSRPAVSQHLRVLKQAGLVSDTAVGTRRVYRLDAAGFAALRSWLDDFWSDALEAFKTAAEEQDRAQRSERR